MKSLKLDCRFFNGDKPCKLHKETGIKCVNCKNYQPILDKLLIIKLGAPGDVLRTTPLLIEAKRRNPSLHITWITLTESLPLLENNHYIDRLWVPSWEALARLQVEEFHKVFSLDNSPECASLASLARAPEKRGFHLNTRGSVVPLTPEAAIWLEMAAFDDVKKTNYRTYQEIIFSICGYKFDPQIHEIMLPLRPAENLFSQKFAQDHDITKIDPVIGINIGSGRRWPKKIWGYEKLVELIERLLREINLKIILMGGPGEDEKAKKIINILREKNLAIIPSGCHNPLRDFIAIVDLCQVVVTGDTLALHISAALKKQIVALFGPTSAAEIELYGRGAKISSEMPCLCCYKQFCDLKPDCMDALPVEKVFAEVIAAQDRLM